MSWLVPRNELTAAQRSAVESNPLAHQLVLGSPGSGKTIVALHRARHLIDMFRCDASRCRLFVYTTVLQKYIEAGLRDLALPGDCVTTFDDWCCLYYQEHVHERLPRNLRFRGYDWEAIRQGVWKETRKLGILDRIYDFAVVDEGQDLDARDFETLAGVARHVTVFMDPKQRLYDRDADEFSVTRSLGLNRRSLTLLDGHRCSPYIVQVAASFVSDVVQRRRFVSQTPVTQRGERQTPLLYLARTPEDEIAQLIDVVRTRIARSESVGILVPTRRYMTSCARALIDAGIDVEIKRNRYEGHYSPGIPSIDFGTNRPKVMPFPSAKGLTFDSVLMPRLDSKFFEVFGKSRFERWLFVGITRASRWLYFSTTKGEGAPFINRFRDLEHRNQLTIMDGKPMLRPTAPGEPATDDQEQGTDFSDLFA